MKIRLGKAKSVSVKSIVLFLAFLIPIYLIGFGIFSWGRNSIRNQAKEAQVNRAEFYVESLNAEVDWIRSLQYDLFSDVTLNRLSDTLHIMSNYDRDMSVLSIQNRLKTIINSSRYISEMRIIIPSIDRVITFRSMEELSSSDLDLLNGKIDISSSGSYYKNNTIYLYATAHVGYNPNNRAIPKFCMTIGLSGTAITQAIRSLLQTGEDFIYYRMDTDLMHTSFTDGAIAAEIIKALDGEKVSFSANPQRVQVNAETYQVYRTISKNSDLTYISVLNEKDLYRPINDYLLLFLLFSFIVLLFIFLFAYYFRRVIHLPLTRLLKAFQQVEEGNLDIRIKHSNEDEFHEIYGGFNHMTHRLDQMINQVYRQKLLAQNAELRQLQAQINPHFLFNCFFILKRRIKYGDIDTATLLADHLGEYFQFITRTASDTIPLSDEVRHARIYTDIQASRFADRITVRFDELPVDFAGIMVGRLILQPIIENAFEYGLEDKTEGGELRISFSEEKDCIVIAIEDNGDRLDDETLSRLNIALTMTDGDMDDGNTEITGILNIHRRIRYQMGERAGLRLSRSSLGGLLAELFLVLPESSPDDVEE